MALDVNLRDATSGTPLAVTSAGALRIAPPADGSAFYMQYPHNDSTLDAFEKLRTSESRNVFEYNFGVVTPALATTIWQDSGPITGSSAALTAQLYGLDLNTTTTAASGYWIQTFAHTRYRPGISVLFRITFNFNELISNVRSRIGMFTDQGTFPSTTGDGFYLEADGTAVSVVRRYATTSATGLEERALQGAWNLDTLDGTGASGITINWTKAQHFVVEYQWLGVGNIRFGFDCGGTDGIVWCHQFTATNNLTGPWSRTGSLPVRAEIFNTSGTAQNGKLTLINTVVQHEGAIEERLHRYFAASSGTTVRTIGTAAGLFPIMSLRAATTNALTTRARIRPVRVSITVTTAGTGTTSIQVALLMLPTPNTGATFAVTTGGSVTTVDIAATATTAVTGTPTAMWIIPNALGTYNFDVLNDDDNMNLIGFQANNTAAITGSGVLTLAAGTLTGTTTAAPAFAASITWKEIV